jgi:serine/threonine-protein kinase
VALPAAACGATASLATPDGLAAPPSAACGAAAPRATRDALVALPAAACGATASLATPDGLAAPPAAACGAAAPLADDVATDPGTRLGTPGFMAPEQGSGDRDAIGPASDVYALGALLFWLWARDPPPSTSAADVRARLIACRPAPSKRLVAIAMRCLEPRPESRYADAAALLDDIGRLRGGLAVAALPETVFDRLWRFVSKYRTFILLIAAYLVMRTVIALMGR